MLMSCNINTKKPNLKVSDVHYTYIKNYNYDILGDTNTFDANYQMKIYADSLNFLVKTDSLPSFVFNPCFDNKPIFWKSLHSAVSLRKMILDNVTNKVVLERLYKNNKLKIICIISSKEIEIPLSEKSFSELSKERLKELY